MSTQTIPMPQELTLNFGENDPARAAVFQNDDLSPAAEHLAEAHCRRCGSHHRELLDQEFLVWASTPEGRKVWRP